eukprot:13789420-Alexandrium_andersonii.AAC.1
MSASLVGSEMCIRDSQLNVAQTLTRGRATFECTVCHQLAGQERARRGGCLEDLALEHASAPPLR